MFKDMKLDFPALLALIVAAAFIVLVFVLILVKPAIPDAAWAVIGILGTAFSTVVAFYWGSSAGSKAKDAAMLPQTPQAPKEGA